MKIGLRKVLNVWPLEKWVELTDGREIGRLLADKGLASVKPKLIVYERVAVENSQFGDWNPCRPRHF